MPCVKGMTGCRVGCAHRRFVGDYRVERERQVVGRETETGGWPTEVAGAGPIVTFKRWLTGHAGGPEVGPRGRSQGDDEASDWERAVDQDGW